MKSVITPSRTDLVSAYNTLQFGKKLPGLDKIVLWTHWSRLDARLAEILVQFFAKNYSEIPILSFWEVNLASPEPAVLGVLLGFSRNRVLQMKGRRELTKFLIWQRAVLTGVKKAPFQKFFVDDGRPNPGRAMREIENSKKVFKSWGFYSSEYLSSRETKLITLNKLGATRLSPEDRRGKLLELMTRKEPFRVSDYIKICGGQLHPRTAERDLRSMKGLKRKGSTRSRYYFLG